MSLNIAISTRYMRSALSESKDKAFYTRRDYLEMSKKYDFCLIPYLPGMKLSSIDGAIIPDADDTINPCYYSSADTDCIPYNDYETDSRLLTLARSNSIPVLGIGYGMHAINVFLEGSLKKAEVPFGRHYNITLDKEKVLNTNIRSLIELIGSATKGNVTSNCFECVDNLANALVPIIINDHDDIEAFVSSDGMFCGVQWALHKDIFDETNPFGSTLSYLMLSYFLYQCASLKDNKEALFSNPFSIIAA